MFVVHNQNRLFVKMLFLDKIREFYILDIMQNHDIIYVLRQNKLVKDDPPCVGAFGRKRCAV